MQIENKGNEPIRTQSKFLQMVGKCAGSSGGGGGGGGEGTSSLPGFPFFSVPGSREKEAQVWSGHVHLKIWD